MTELHTREETYDMANDTIIKQRLLAESKMKDCFFFLDTLTMIRSQSGENEMF